MPPKRTGRAVGLKDGGNGVRYKVPLTTRMVRVWWQEMKDLETSNMVLKKRIAQLEGATDDGSSSSESETASLGTSSDEDVDEYIDYGRLGVNK